MRKEVIGDATLYCGDCFDTLPPLDLSGIDLLLTDPPYGCTRNAWDTAIDLQAFWQMALPMVKDNAACCIFSQMPFSADVVVSQKKLFRYDLVYQKEGPVGFLNAKRMPLRAHELILVFYRALPTYNPQKFSGKPYLRTKEHRSRHSATYDFKFFKTTVSGTTDGTRFPISVLYLHAEQDFYSKEGYIGHPTQKPVSVNSWLIKTYTNPQETVLDPFMGSGSTGVAALKCGRKFIGVEKEEKYFDTACYRMEKALAEMELLHLAAGAAPVKQPEQLPLVAGDAL